MEQNAVRKHWMVVYRILEVRKRRRVIAEQGIKWYKKEDCLRTSGRGCDRP